MSRFDLEEEYGHYEERVRIRPNPKANRPRTKRRPDHVEAVLGMIVGVSRGRYRALLLPTTANEHLPTPNATEVLAARARELRRTPIVPGDVVRLVGDVSGTPGTLARIVGITDRKTVLRRSADDSDQVERVLVANATQMLIVVAAADPEPRVRLVDRYLVAAYDAGIRPLLCITKTDLADPTQFLSHFTSLAVPVVLSQPDAWPLAELRAALEGELTVLVGHSGVGKSTLINELAPSAERATGHVNEVTGRGRHTSSSSEVFFVPSAAADAADAADAAAGPSAAAARGGWAVDTPGVRSFGLGHVTSDSVLRGFADLAKIASDCPRGCTHLTDAPDCALDEAVASGRLDTVGAARLDSLRRLL